MDTKQTSPFYFDEPTETVQIHLPDGRVITGPRGASVEEFLKPLHTQEQAPILGAVVNDRLTELRQTISTESRVRPVGMDTADGMRIYRRSLTLLLNAALKETFPGVEIVIDHSVSFGGYFCQILPPSNLSDEDIQKLEVHMRQLVAADLPILKLEVPIEEAIAYFDSQGYTDKVNLLRHRKKEYLVLYELGQHRDYHHGYMVPSTAYIQWFSLAKLNGGFTLRFPRRHAPTRLSPLGDYPKLLTTFRQYGDWLERLGIDNVGALNDAVLDGRVREVILVSEALHEQQIAAMASEIANRKETRLVLIAGPSSSGKTTSSRRLSVQLLSQGIEPYPLEMDNYFVNRERTPRDENGEFYYEHIDAIDRPRLNHDLKKLIKGEEVRLPHFDFKTGRSDVGELVHLSPEHLVIVEGIHGLNPELIGDIPEEQVFRIYISALTQLNLDRHNRVSTTDTRLIRRIVRDARTRGYSPQETIQRWESVRRGEKEYIFPYQENANRIFNSALVYELSVLKKFAEPLLRQVPFGTPEHLEVKRLLALLEWFQPLGANWIPDNSLLREFIGGSILQDFRVLRNNRKRS